jgi:hypothetical protein
MRLRLTGQRYSCRASVRNWPPACPARLCGNGLGLPLACGAASAHYGCARSAAPGPATGLDGRQPAGGSCPTACSSASAAVGSCARSGAGEAEVLGQKGLINEAELAGRDAPNRAPERKRGTRLGRQAQAPADARTPETISQGTDRVTRAAPAARATRGCGATGRSFSTSRTRGGSRTGRPTGGD